IDCCRCTLPNAPDLTRLRLSLWSERGTQTYANLNHWLMPVRMSLSRRSSRRAATQLNRPSRLWAGVGNLPTYFGQVHLRQRSHLPPDQAIATFLIMPP